MISRMNKQIKNEQGVILPLVIILVFVVAGIAVFFGTQGNNPVLSQLSGRFTGQSNQQAMGGKTETKPTSEAKIQVTSIGLVPQTISVAKGQQVTFTNTDSKSHQIISGDTILNLDSESLNTNDSYSYTFETPGTYELHDRLNPLKIKGTVIVK